MPRHAFDPEAFAPPYTTARIDLLFRTLVNKRLGGDWWQHQREALLRGRDGFRVQAVGIDVEKELLDDLQADLLVAHAHLEKSLQFHRIPCGYWREDEAALALRGHLPALSEGWLIANALIGAAVIVRNDIAIAWLDRHEIKNSSPFFPPQLRPITPKSAKRKGRPHLYDWPAFERHAIAILDEHGALGGDWNQARLEEKMLEWCGLTWGREPTLRPAREHVTVALRRFVELRGDGAEE